MASTYPERISVSMVGEIAEFVVSYKEEHGDPSNSDIVRRGLRMLKLIDSLEPHQRLAIEDTQAETTTPVIIPWETAIGSVTVPEI